MTVEERVQSLLKGKIYEKGMKDIELSKQEKDTIICSMNFFRKNIKPDNFLAKMKLSMVDRLINRNEYTKLPISDIRTVCEALYDVLQALNYFETGELKLKYIDDLFIKMQMYGEYNFLKQLDKCHRRKAKSDIGGDAMELLVNGFKN